MKLKRNFFLIALNYFVKHFLKITKPKTLFFETSDTKFSIEKFAPFIHQNNIFEIIEALEDASYHIERNGNAKIIFTDLSIQLTRLIHKKELV